MIEIREITIGWAGRGDPRLRIEVGPSRKTALVSLDVEEFDLRPKVRGLEPLTEAEREGVAEWLGTRFGHERLRPAETWLARRLATYGGR